MFHPFFDSIPLTLSSREPTRPRSNSFFSCELLRSVITGPVPPKGSTAWFSIVYSCPTARCRLFNNSTLPTRRRPRYPACRPHPCPPLSCLLSPSSPYDPLCRYPAPFNDMLLRPSGLLAAPFALVLNGRARARVLPAFTRPDSVSFPSSSNMPHRSFLLLFLLSDLSASPIVVQSASTDRNSVILLTSAWCFHNASFDFFFYLDLIKPPL